MISPTIKYSEKGVWCRFYDFGELVISNLLEKMGSEINRWRVLLAVSTDDLADFLAQFPDNDLIEGFFSFLAKSPVHPRDFDRLQLVQRLEMLSQSDPHKSR